MYPLSGDLSDRATTCTAAPPPSRTTCLQFPEIVVSAADLDEEQCHQTPLDLHLTDAEVVVSPALTWKRLGRCRTVSVVHDERVIRVRGRLLVRILAVIICYLTKVVKVMKSLCNFKGTKYY